MTTQDWRVKTALFKQRVSKFNPNHDEAGRFSSGPGGGGGGAAPRADGGALRRANDAYDAAKVKAAEDKKEWEVKYKAIKARRAAAAKDPRVKAVRAHKKLGEGSEQGRQSFTYNTMEDDELLGFLDDLGATTPAKAIKTMLNFEEIKREQYEEMKNVGTW